MKKKTLILIWMAWQWDQGASTTWPLLEPKNSGKNVARNLGPTTQKSGNVLPEIWVSFVAFGTDRSASPTRKLAKRAQKNVEHHPEFFLFKQDFFLKWLIFLACSPKNSGKKRELCYLRARNLARPTKITASINPFHWHVLPRILVQSKNSVA